MKNLASGLKILLILLISCSSDDSGDGNPSSSSVGECVGADNICPSSSSAPSSSGGVSPPSSSSLSIGSPFQVNSQIYVWNSDREDSSEEYTGSGEIKIKLRKSDDCSGEDCYCDEDDQCGLYISAGTVTNGIVNLNLSSTIPDKYSIEYPNQDGLSVVPSDVRMASIEEQIYLFTDTGEWMMIPVGIMQPNTANPRKEEMIVHVYLSKAATVTGEFSRIEASCDRTYYLDINGKAGWNMIYWSIERTRVSNSCQNVVEHQSTNNIFTKVPKWIINSGTAQ